MDSWIIGLALLNIQGGLDSLVNILSRRVSHEQED